MKRSRLLVTKIGEWRRRWGCLQLRWVQVGWLRRACLLHGRRGSHRFDIGNDLPALLRWQRPPGGHAVIFVAPRNEPEHFTPRNRIEPSVHQGRHVPRAISRLPLPPPALTRIYLFPAIPALLLPSL